MATRTSRARRTDCVLLIGTAKGAFVLEPRRARANWQLRGPWHFGSRVHDVHLDPRDGRTLLACAAGGHLGPTIFRSTRRGRAWEEASAPPRFRKAPKKGPTKRPKKGAKDAVRGARGQAVNLNFWLSPGHPDEPEVWYCGTSPPGLFRSKDGGQTWKGVRGFNENPSWKDWTGDGRAATPDGAFLHSICVDPRDPAHLYLSLSIGGTFESRDRGRTWRPLNRGVEADFLPQEDPEYGQDPHCMILHPADPDRLFQQNHCGIYRLDRHEGGERWERVGRRMPKRIGDIGFPIVGHPRRSDSVWVFPMDGTSVWPRTSPGGKPAVYRTSNGGRTWQRLDAGLPPENAWFTVMRQAMTADDHPRRVGLYFGTTSGEVWASRNEGEDWERIAEHLPRIYSVRAVRWA